MSNNGKILKVNQAIIDTYDSEATLLYPLKESEAIALLAFVEYFNWRTRWDNLTMTDEELFAFTASVADALMNPLDGGVIVGTVEDICQGVLCALQEAGGILAGGLGGNLQLTPNEDGGFTLTADGQPPSGGGQSVQSQREAKGDAEFVQDAISEYLQDWETFYNYQTPATNVVMERLLSSKYAVDEAQLTNSVTEYINWRNGSGNPLSWGVINLSRDLFCRGNSLGTVNDFMIDGGATTDLLDVLNVLSPLTQAQFDEWADESERVSDDFVNTDCYRAPIVSFNLTVADFNTNDQFPLNNVIPSARQVIVRLLVDITDGTNTYDGMYLFNGSTYSYQPMRFEQSNTALASTPSTQPARDLDGSGYDVIYQNSSQYFATPFDIQPYTGTIALEFEDRGNP